MLGLAAMVVACENGGESGGSIDYEKGYKYLSSLNVSDAKMLYKKDATTMRSGDSDDSYWKLDLNGNESKLIITGEDGTENNIEIISIVKFNNSLLYVVPRAQQIIDLIYTPSGNGETVSVMSDSNEFALLVDTRTEKMYQCPSEIKESLFLITYADENGFDSGFKYKSDANDNVYIGGNGSIYKIDIKDFTVSSMLPDGVTFNDFDVTSDGYIVYINDIVYKIKCPTGRIVPIDGICFFIGDDIYSCDEMTIYKWSKEDNNLISSVACVVEPVNDLDVFYIIYVLENPTNNSVALIDNWYNWYDFDGTTSTKTSVNFEYYTENGKYIYTNKAWYVKESYGFGKIAMSDYEMSMVEINDYDIITYTATAESPNITVTGYQYSDGANFVGSINENDELVVDEVLTGSTLVDLIPLN